MDLQTILENAVKSDRSKELAESDQLTLGELILKVEAINPNPDSEPLLVYYDFCGFYPNVIDSYRGIYAELALGYCKESQPPMNLSMFKELLKKSIGKTFTGYKGGDFTMSRQTPIWVANYGNSCGSTAVVDVNFDDYGVILITKKMQ